MALEGIDDEAIARGIKFLEDSLFKNVVEHRDHGKDFRSTLPGFNMANNTTVPHYHVHVNVDVLYKQGKRA